MVPGLKNAKRSLENPKCLTNDNVNNKQPSLCMYSQNTFEEKLSNKILGLVKVHLFVVMF